MRYGIMPRLGGHSRELSCVKIRPGGPVREQVSGVVINRYCAGALKLLLGRAAAEDTYEWDSRLASSFSVVLGVSYDAGLRRNYGTEALQSLEKDIRRWLGRACVVCSHIIVGHIRDASNRLILIDFVRAAGRSERELASGGFDSRE